MPLSRLKLSHIRGEDGKPRLRAKAAVTRDFIPIVLRMLESHFPHESDHDVARFNCLRYLNDCHVIIDEEWTGESAARLEESCRRFMFFHVQLLAEQVARGGTGCCGGGILNTT